jgi:threonyl-tRNA synthetase
MREVEERTVSVRRLGDKRTTVISLNEAVTSLTQEALAPDLA